VPRSVHRDVTGAEDAETPYCFIKKKNKISYRPTDEPTDRPNIVITAPTHDARSQSRASRARECAR